MYSFPNIILPFFGGNLVDKIGVRFGIFIFSFILIVGQGGNKIYLVFTLGGYYEIFYLMLTGRIIFGLGGECLGVT